MHKVHSLYPYDGDNMGVVRVLCPNDGDNTHAVRALMEQLTDNMINPGKCSKTQVTHEFWFNYELKFYIANYHMGVKVNVIDGKTARHIDMYL